VNLFAFRAASVFHPGVPFAHRLFSTLTIPQRLLVASGFAYAAVFAGILAFGRPGLGLGQAFFVPIVLVAAATSPLAGALAGAGALFLFELAIHDKAGDFTWVDFTHASAVSRLVSFVAVGALAGFLARRGRLMLAQSLYVLEDLVEIAHARLEDAALDEAPPDVTTETLLG
jgi:hypothetical protein